MHYRCFRRSTWRRHEPLRLPASLNRHRHPRQQERWLNQLAQADLAAAVLLQHQPALWPQRTPSRRKQRLPGCSGGDNDLPRACPLEEWPCSPRSPFDRLVQTRTAAAGSVPFDGHQIVSIVSYCPTTCFNGSVSGSITLLSQSPISTSSVLSGPLTVRMYCCIVD